MTRTERKTFRLSPREVRLVEAAAENADTDFSSFVRRHALDGAADELLPGNRRSDGADGSRRRGREGGEREGLPS